MTYDAWLLETTCRTFHRTCAALADPPVDDVPRALRLMTPLCDTLEGFAIGCAIGHVANAVRRWSGDDAARDVLRRLRVHIRTAARPEPDELAPSLAAEFAARMHRRLVHMPVATFVAEAGAAASPIATRDDLLAVRLATEIELGWQHYRAVLLGARLPTTSPLWHTWDRKVRGERDAVLRDYVLRVA